MAVVAAADGLELYAEVHGSGIPLVFSCGYCTTHQNFRPQVEPLVAAGAKVILWDYRGHGKSGLPAEGAEFSMDTVVDDLERVLDWAAPGEPAVLAGLSLGGLVSLHFTLQHRERVRGLILIDSGPGFKKPEAQARWVAQTERTAFFLESRGMQALVEGKAAGTTIGRRPELPAAQAAAEAIAAQDPRGVAQFGRQVVASVPGVIDELAGIELPALVIVGEEDDPYLQAGEVMASRLPQSQHVTLPRAGHISNIEEADAFNACVARFLADLGAHAG